MSNHMQTRDEQLLNAVLSYADVGILVCDAQGGLIRINQKAREILSAG